MRKVVRSGSVRLGCRVLGFALCLAACARDHRGMEKKPVEAPAGRGGDAAAAGTPATGPDKPRDSGKREVGARATAVLEVIDPAAPGGDWRPRGPASFLQTMSSVNLTIIVSGCPRDTKPYEVYVKQGTDCSPQTLRGPNWDGGRGEGMPHLPCATTGVGRLFHTRPSDSDASWSIGSPAGSDLLGHALVLVDAGSGEAISCGVIGRDQETPTQEPVAPAMTDAEIERLAPIAGLCLAASIVRDNTQNCPDPKELVKCGEENCQVSSCQNVCSDYIACMAREDDPCSVAFSCPLTQECADCQGRVQMCMLGFCVEQIACAPPAKPGGPCSQLEACCAIQGDQSGECLETVKLLAKLSGDPSCYGAIHDWDFFSHLPVPCEFE